MHMLGYIGVRETGKMAVMLLCPPCNIYTCDDSCFSCGAGNLVGLFLSPLLLAKLGWRGLFFVFGALGLPLLAAWLAIVPKPPQLLGVHKTEAAAVEPRTKRAMSAVPGEVALPEAALL